MSPRKLAVQRRHWRSLLPERLLLNGAKEPASRQGRLPLRLRRAEAPGSGIHQNRRCAARSFYKAPSSILRRENAGTTKTLAIYIRAYVPERFRTSDLGWFQPHGREAPCLKD